jgi:hypothetical protein
MQLYHEGQVIYLTTGYPTHNGTRFHWDVYAARVVAYMQDKDPKQDRYKVEYLDPKYARNRIPYWMARDMPEHWFPSRKAAWESIIQRNLDRRQRLKTELVLLKEDLKVARAKMRRELAKEKGEHRP